MRLAHSMTLRILPLPFHIGEHGHLHGIVIEIVVRRELEIPFQLAGVGIERDHGIAVEIGALANVAVPVGTGIADAPVGQIQLRIVGAGNPDGSAAVLPGIARPCLMAGLARAGDRVEPPGFFAGRGIVGREKPANAELAAGHARR